MLGPPLDGAAIGLFGPGLLAGSAGPRTAIAIAGVLLLATPLLLPRQDDVLQHERRRRTDQTSCQGESTSM